MSKEETRALCAFLADKERLSVWPVEGLESIEVCDGEKVWAASFLSCGDAYNELLRLIVKKKLISHQVKDLIRLLLDEGLDCDGFVFDTALAGYLLDATDGEYSLARLSARYLGGEYAGAEAVWRLYAPMNEKLGELGMDGLYYAAELPLCRVLAEMERIGFLVDRKALYEFGESLNEQIEQLQLVARGA